jgi:dienelactone hydrolase
MIRILLQSASALLIIVGAILPVAAGAQVPPSAIGVVVMHGKGGMPARHVSDLASSLAEKGYLVANLEMPWSGRRNYDVPIHAAEGEIESAFAALKSKGAQKLFIAGHSLGGQFALYFGGRQRVDGVIAMAPGGSVSSPILRKELADSLAQARKLVADGKGDEPTSLRDFEAARGAYRIHTVPSAYVTWFDPDGPMNMSFVTGNMSSQIPVLFVVPTNDYPILLKTKQAVFGALPRHPLTRLYEPNASHLGAPGASVEEIARWITEVVNAKP